MSNIIRRRSTRISAALATAAISLGVAAGPASAQQSGLVNVDIQNVLNNNSVAVVIPVNAAANICDVDVVALANDVRDNGSTTCTGRAGQQVTVSQHQ